MFQEPGIQHGPVGPPRHGVHDHGGGHPLYPASLPHLLHEPHHVQHDAPGREAGDVAQVRRDIQQSHWQEATPNRTFPWKPTIFMP